MSCEVKIDKMHIYNYSSGKLIGLVISKYSNGVEWLIEIKDAYDTIYTVEANRVMDRGDKYELITDY